MSLLLAPSPLPNLPLSDGHRKRTNSFSFPALSFTPSPRPAKAARTTTATTSTSDMGSLRRTQSFLVLPSFIDLGPSPSTSMPSRPSSPPQIPYNRSLRAYKDQRERRKGLLHRAMEQPITLRTKPQSSFSLLHGQGSSQPAPTSSAVGPSFSHTRRGASTLGSDPVSTASTSMSISDISASASTSGSTSVPTLANAPKTQRTTSLLAPVRTGKPPCRPSFPRSKPEPDLYRRAITTRMMGSPEGQKILAMGPRLAVSIITATRELEKIVAAQDVGRDCGRDVDLDFEDMEDVVMVDAESLMPTPVNSPTKPVSTTRNFPLAHPYAAAKDDWEMVDSSA